jgi:hypothetical protein
MERVVRNVYGHTRTHPDLEGFRPQEHNTLHPLFCIAPVRSWSIELEKSDVYIGVACGGLVMD